MSYRISVNDWMLIQEAAARVIPPVGNIIGSNAAVSLPNEKQESSLFLSITMINENSRIIF
jgi:hypothetical protein